MRFSISRALLGRLLGEAAAADGREICGLLLGRPGDIRDSISIPNAAPDPAHGYLLDPAAQISAVRAARLAGHEVLGHYHSHPSGRPEPSPDDAAHAGEQGRLWLILAAGQARLWLSRRGGTLLGAFDPAEMERVGSSALQPGSAAANRCRTATGPVQKGRPSV